MTVFFFALIYIPSHKIDKLNDYKKCSKKIDFARANGGWDKNTLLVAATIVAGFIVSIPQAACSGVV